MRDLHKTLPLSLWLPCSPTANNNARPCQESLVLSMPFPCNFPGGDWPDKLLGLWQGASCEPAGSTPRASWEPGSSLPSSAFHSFIHRNARACIIHKAFLKPQQRSRPTTGMGQGTCIAQGPGARGQRHGPGDPHGARVHTHTGEDDHISPWVPGLYSSSHISMISLTQSQRCGTCSTRAMAPAQQQPSLFPTELGGPQTLLNPTQRGEKEAAPAVHTSEGKDSCPF